MTISPTIHGVPVLPAIAAWLEGHPERTAYTDIRDFYATAQPGDLMLTPATPHKILIAGEDRFRGPGTMDAIQLRVTPAFFDGEFNIGRSTQSRLTFDAETGYRFHLGNERISTTTTPDEAFARSVCGLSAALAGRSAESAA